MTTYIYCAEYLCNEFICLLCMYMGTSVFYYCLLLCSPTFILDKYNSGYLSHPFSFSALYRETMQLKNQNPDLKILLAVGGWNHGTETFTEMVSLTRGNEYLAIICQLYKQSVQHQALCLDVLFMFGGNFQYHIMAHDS